MDDYSTPVFTADNTRRAYSKPTLVVYGSVARLTQTQKGSFSDNNQNNCNHANRNTNPACGSLF